MHGLLCSALSVCALRIFSLRFCFRTLIYHGNYVESFHKIFTSHIALSHSATAPPATTNIIKNIQLDSNENGNYSQQRQTPQIYCIRSIFVGQIVCSCLIAAIAFAICNLLKQNTRSEHTHTHKIVVLSKSKHKAIHAFNK